MSSPVGVCATSKPVNITVPPEIIGRIIDNFVADHGEQALLEVSKAGKAFRAASMGHIFGSVVFKQRTGRTWLEVEKKKTAFAAAIEECDKPLRFIRQLSIIVTRKDQEWAFDTEMLEIYRRIAATRRLR